MECFFEKINVFVWGDIYCYKTNVELTFVHILLEWFNQFPEEGLTPRHPIQSYAFELEIEIIPNVKCKGIGPKFTYSGS